EVDSGKEIQHIVQKKGVRLPPSNCLALSRDGAMLASPKDDIIYLWETASGRELHQLKGHKSRVTALTFSPDGRTLASSSGRAEATEHSIRLWDVKTGKELRTLEKAQWHVRRLTFSPDGSILAAVIDGNICASICLWDATTGKALRQWSVDSPA